MSRNVNRIGPGKGRAGLGAGALLALALLGACGGSSGSRTTYRISGTISGAVAAGVTVRLTGGTIDTSVTSNGGGGYSFADLPNGTYTVTPSRAGFKFDPPSQAVTVSGADVGGKDFTATAVAAHAISGSVSGAVAAGVTITLTSTASSQVTTTTDGAGHYGFSAVIDGMYVLTASKDGFAFGPPSVVVTLNGADLANQDFTSVAIAGATHAIRGTIANAGAGVLVTIARASAAPASLTAASQPATTLTDGDGKFQIAGLTDAPYVITPSKIGWTFEPANLSVQLAGADLTGIGFTGAAQSGGTHAISGLVLDAVTRAPMAGATVTLSGAANASTTTGTDGAYQFVGLADGTYTLTPTRSGYAFNPTTITGQVKGADVVLDPSKAFLATAAPGGTHAISGRVSGATAAGVSVKLAGTATGNVITDASGAYRFDGLLNGAYTVTPSKAGFTFAPEAAAVTLGGADASGKDFIASASTTSCAISGTITGAWVEGIPVALAGAAKAATLTDADGHYQFSNLSIGQYTVTPALPGYAYAPTQATVQLTTAEAVQDFSASSVVPAYVMSGKVTYAGAMTGRVVISVEGDNGWSGETSIAAPGSFVLRGLPPGKYDLHAYMDAYDLGWWNAIEPQSADQQVTVGTHDVSGVTVVMHDPSGSVPTQPPSSPPAVYAGNGSAVVTWPSGGDYVSAHRVTWWPEADSTKRLSVQVPGRYSTYLVSGLTDGAQYRFQVDTLAGSQQNGSQTVGPIAIGAKAGDATTATVSGKVSFPGVATGPLYVVLVNPRVYPQVAYLQRVENPVSPQAYAISGVPAGRYEVVAAIDSSQDGMIEAGEPAMGMRDKVGLDVAQGVIHDLTLTTPSARAVSTTSAWKQGAYETYSLNAYVDGGSKVPVNVTLISGRGFPVPCDLGSVITNGRTADVSGAVPSAGDAYRFLVQYSDGTSEIVTATVDGFVGFARDMGVNVAAPYSTAAPLFTWSAPKSPPADFQYTLDVGTAFSAPTSPFSSTTIPVWSYLLPATTSQVQFNVDSMAPAGDTDLHQLATTYPYVQWSVTVIDAKGNSSTNVMQYTH